MKQDDLGQIREKVADIARRTGDLLLTLFGQESLKVTFKADSSPVTQADMLAQDLILTELSRHFPGIPIVSEELGVGANTLALGDVFFLVDPLDSTKNFTTRIPFFDVSIALVQDGRPVVGVIRDPVHKTTYSAVHSRGAWEEGSPIRVRPCPGLADADLDVNVTRLSPEQYRRVALKVVPKAKKVRYFGSAVIEACWVASGRLDGILNHPMATWDIAAATLIVEESGGIWGDVSGSPYRLDSLNKRAFFAVGDPRVMKEVVRLIED